VSAEVETEQPSPLVRQISNNGVTWIIPTLITSPSSPPRAAAEDSTELAVAPAFAGCDSIEMTLC
jgi:hypothetical protein